MSKLQNRSHLRYWLRRSWNSTVIWACAFNFLRFGSSVLLLPLLLNKLTGQDLGMYFLFWGILQFIPVLNQGFSQTVGRFVGYAMGGARGIAAGRIIPNESGSEPNYKLLGRIMHSTKLFYQIFSLLGLVVLGAAGSIVVALRVEETSDVSITWLAWGFALTGAFFELYAGWWSIFLQGMNEVRASIRIVVVAYSIKLAVAAILLVMGLGLLSTGLASFVASGVWVFLSRAQCLSLLPEEALQKPSAGEVGELLKKFWPTSWRLGLQGLSTYLANYCNLAVCAIAFGLEVTARYGLTIQMMEVVLSVASVWVLVKWPLVNQLRARKDTAQIRHLLWPRYWLQQFSFLGMVVVVIFVGPRLISWIAPDKSLLSGILLLIFGLYYFLRMNFIFWATLISTENRIPTLWPTVVTNSFSLVAVIHLTFYAGMGVQALVAVPLIAGLLFNFWYWGILGANSLGTSWAGFVFARCRREPYCQDPGIAQKP